MKTLTTFAVTLIAMSASAFAEAPIAPVSERFASGKTTEVPSFRRHMMPLMGRLGCNGRSCHGSFQGRGGFMLSLFGYDFDKDHKAMTAGDEPRVNLQKPLESLIIQKPTNEEIHEGGKRMSVGSWQYHVFKRWIEGGAKNVRTDHPKFLGLDITPRELAFRKTGEKIQLKVIARWSDGKHEDVTPLCRFHSNATEIATITEDGLVTSTGPGDTHVVVNYDTGVVPVPVVRPVTDLVDSRYPRVPAPTKIDQLVIQKLRKLGIVPSELSTDAEFLRRVSLDLTGTLPPPREVEAFLADHSSNKRARKINELLKSKAYAAWWTTKLCDFTGNNDDGLVNIIPVRGRASEDWYNWIYKRVEDNTPYDKLVEGIVVATSRNRGETYEEYCKNMSELYKSGSTKKFADRHFMPYYWARRNFRTPEERAIGFAYTFLGMRIQCAQCHKHPFDRWTKSDFEQFTKFFASTQSGIRDRDKYQEMLEKLNIKGKRGNQARRELAKLLEQGKVVPFQEVYAGRARTRRRGNNNKAVRNLQRQVKALQQRVAALKKAGKLDAAKKVQKQLTGVATRLKRLQRNSVTNNQTSGAKLLGGDKVDLSKHEDARVPLMNWLRDEKHGMLARAFVNRVWASYFNVGIINPPDDLSLANPPSNKPLLDYLTEGFIKNNYDMKWLHREILTSRTYQLSWKPNETNVNDERNFSHAIPRRLPAEVAYDALRQATASDEVHASMRNNLENRAIAIPGAGRRNRNSRGAAYALTIFGRSVRESNCDCDRSMEPSLLQTVYLQNDNDIYSMIERNRDGWLGELAKEMGIPFRGVAVSNNDNARNRRRLQAYRKAYLKLAAQLKKARSKGDRKTVARLQRQIVALRKRAGLGKTASTPKRNSSSAQKSVSPMNTDSIVKQAYLRTLSRLPNDKERAAATKYLKTAKTPIDGVRDLMWALLNTKEFIINH
ncbi:MAG: DUF1549 and DUF1553 domain-containing protein [Planctomycetaceae bacterium]